MVRHPSGQGVDEGDQQDAEEQGEERCGELQPDAARVGVASRVTHQHQPAAQQDVVAGRMDVARRVAQQIGQAAAGEEGADGLVIPQAVGAEAV